MLIDTTFEDKLLDMEGVHWKPVARPDKEHVQMAFMRGSHTYNTAEMSRLIDATVEQAKELGISRNTVAKYCDGDTYPGQRSPYHRDAGVVTPDVIAFIQSCLQEDAQEPNRKQHHTARRIFERLVDELDSSTTPVLL